MSNSISVGGFISFSLDNLKENWLKFIGLGLFAVFVGIGCVFVTRLLAEIHSILGVLAVIASVAMGATIMFGFLKNILNLCRGQAVDLGAFIRVKPKVIVYFLVAGVIVGATVITGMFLLVVPGICLAYLLMLTPFLIIDREIGPIKAIDESYKLTKDHLLDVFIVTFIGSIILNLISMFIITLILTIPMMCLMYVYLYLQLTGQFETAQQQFNASITPAPIPVEGPNP